MGEDHQIPLTRGGLFPSHTLHQLMPSALGERRWRSMAVPHSKSRRRPCDDSYSGTPPPTPPNGFTIQDAGDSPVL